MIKITNSIIYYESTYLTNNNNTPYSNFGAPLRVGLKETYSYTIKYTIRQWREYYLVN